MARGPKKKPQQRKQAATRKQVRARSKQTGKGGVAEGRPGPRHKPDVRIDKAQIAWQARRYDEAIMHYEAALARDPTNAVLLVDVARAYGLRFRLADAEELVDRACRLHPDDAQLQCMLGRTYRRLQQFDRAIACYQRALQLQPKAADRPQTLLELATMHERLHDLDLARQCASEAQQLLPGWETPRYLLGVIDRRAGEMEAARNRFTRLVEGQRASPGVIADSWYQLAAIHDEAGRYDEAFDALQQAKQILARAASPHRDEAWDIANTSKRTRLAITPEHFQRWNACRDELEPLGAGLALLASHPRSGTTLLEQVLDSHPGLVSADELQVMTEMVYIPICRPAPRELSLPEVYDRAGSAELAKVRRDYWNAMQAALREPVGDRILLDKNPALTGLLPLIGRVFPEMKVLFALRDPRDVVVSCFMQRLPLNPVSVHYLTLQDAAKAYAATMRIWLKLRDVICNPWIEVRYEDTVADIETQSKKALEFLELPWDAVVLDYQRRAQQKHVHSPTYEAVAKPLYTRSIGRWRNYEKHIAPILSTLEPYVREFGYEGPSS